METTTCTCYYNSLTPCAFCPPLKPTSAQHDDHEDGTVTVTYAAGGRVLEAVTYDSKREASIESTLRLFPGTSREWLEQMHGLPTD